MKTCANCQYENEDENRFCIKCGSALNDEAAANAEKPAKKSFLKGKIVLAVVVVLLAAFIVNAIIVSANPAMRLLKGLENLGENGAFTVTGTLNAKYRGDDEDWKLLNDASVKASFAVNLDKMLLEASGSLLYDNKSIADITAGLGEKEVYVDLGKLYDKKFSYSLDKDTREAISELQTLVRYIRHADIKFDRKKYASTLADVLDDNIKGSLGKVTLTVDGELLAETLTEVFDEMTEDEQLMESVRKNAKDIINKMLKDKQEFEILFTEDDLEELLEYVEDEDDFEMAYSSFMEDAMDELEYMLDDLSYYAYNMPEFDVTVSFGSFNNRIKGIKVAYEVENPDDEDESMEITLDTTIKGKASFTKVNTGNAVDIEDLMDNPYEILDIATEVFDNLGDNIKKNKKLANAIEDLTGADLDDFGEWLINEIFF